jgi:hypothetical protein
VRGGLLEQPRERPLGAADQRVQAEEEVAAGVAGEAQLRQRQHLHAALARLRHEAQRLFDVPSGIRDADRRTGGADAQEAEGRGRHCTKDTARRAG